MHDNKNIVILSNKLIDLTKSFANDIRKNKEKIYDLCEHQWYNEDIISDERVNTLCVVCGLCKEDYGRIIYEQHSNS